MDTRWPSLKGTDKFWYDDFINGIGKAHQITNLLEDLSYLIESVLVVALKNGESEIDAEQNTAIRNNRMEILAL